ncbi:hypothetical protein P12x_001633 [Tundrisphaera lichenicola]|uniref:hypothetical protein n=1 Tax=Tundrisphaera lichenicola TaxID=2029860 RepID=UPI003EB8EE01
MIVSDARREANRRNALKSTGPKTPEGKERSRANALKHGLCSSAVVPESIEAIQERASAYYYTLKPQNEFHCWLVNEIAILSMRIDRCERIERRVRDKISLRAELTWDDERRLEAETTGGQIARRPAEISEQLQRTPQGCDWLMRRWAMLAHSADLAGSWTPEQTRLAFDLLGTPAEFRDGRRAGVLLDPEGKVIDTADDLASVARREIAALKDRRALVGDLDEANRELARADLTTDEDPELRRLRRYESTLHRRLRWCLSQLRYESPHRAPHPDLSPRWVAQVEPEETPESSPETPSNPSRSVDDSISPPEDLRFDLDPVEVPASGEILELPEMVPSCRGRSLRRAEARRAARHRKLERLRA